MKSQPFLLLKKEYLEVNLIVSVDGRLTYFLLVKRSFLINIKRSWRVKELHWWLSVLPCCLFCSYFVCWRRLHLSAPSVATDDAGAFAVSKWSEHQRARRKFKKTQPDNNSESQQYGDWVPSQMPLFLEVVTLVSHHICWIGSFSKIACSGKSHLVWLSDWRENENIW